MVKKRKKKKKKKSRKKKKKFLEVPETLKVWIWGVVMFLIAVLILLSFFEKAGVAGNLFMRGATFLVGKTVFITPLLFILVGILFLGNFKDKSKGLAVLAIFILIIGLSGILSTLNPGSQVYSKGDGGLIGLFLSNSLKKAIGLWGGLSFFSALMLIGSLIIIYLFRLHEKDLFGPLKKTLVKKKEKEEKVKEKPLKEKISSKFKVEPLEAEEKEESMATFQDEEMPKIETFKGIEFKKPPLKLLDKEKGKPSSGNIKNNSAIIKRTLRNFDIEVEMSEVNVGPTVTQYTLKPAQGVKLSRIEALNKDLALALARHPIRIEAPIPGRSLVGIEVPNEVRARVRLRPLLSNSKFEKTGSLTFSLGKDVSGEPFYANLDSMPHLLIAGSTGSGKTVCLNSIILSLLYKNGPQSLRLILVDPKRVEFPVYNKLPHLLGDVIFKADQTVRTLKWLISEMERRFDLLSEKRAKDITAFNEENSEHLPYIVLIIDELADLMAAKGKEVENGIVRLAQMARAVGIHLIVATQRPSVEVITGLIKANITSRIAFQVASQVDSRTVFDMAGAEKLLGSGDMLFVSSRIPKPKRIQGSYVSRNELKKVINWIEENQGLEEAKEEEDKLTQELKEEQFQEERTLPGEEDELYKEAKEIVIRRGKASASLLQRRMRIGYARAARIIDALEKEGVIGPSRGSKPREVFDEEF